MTQTEFDTLPALLGKKQFMAVTGLERRQIADMVKAKLLRVWKPFAAGYGKYYKADAAKLAGYVLK